MLPFGHKPHNRARNLAVRHDVLRQSFQRFGAQQHVEVDLSGGEEVHEAIARFRMLARDELVRAFDELLHEIQ